MKKFYTYPLLSILFLLSGCSNESEVPTLEERMAEAEVQTSLKDDSPQVEEDKVKAPAVPDLEIKDETQAFEKYLPVLMFHYIEDIPSNSPDQIRYGLSLSPQKLEEFLVYFKENNIQTLTYWDLVQIMNGEMDFPEKAVMLTFDDGHNDHYTEAFRLLEKYDMKGVFFIISGKPDQDQEYANWQQIQEMSEADQEIASHTVSHPDLTGLSGDALRVELEESKKTLEEKIGKPVISIAYPGGDYNQMTLDVVKEFYTFARTTNSGKDFSLTQRFELPTVRIFPETSVASLKTWFENN